MPLVAHWTEVPNAKEVEALIERAVGTYGRLDYAFNNAGIERMWLPRPSVLRRTGTTRSVST
jgi:NAD(P)-dependent dehydrogenase (short-subunit alcohol dehydrogenase family)